MTDISADRKRVADDLREIRIVRRLVRAKIKNPSTDETTKRLFRPIRVQLEVTYIGIRREAKNLKKS